MQNKKIYYSSLVIQNLKDYILHAANLSQWEAHNEFDNIGFSINRTRESLFNFVSCEDRCTEPSVQKTLNYLKKRNTEETWVINSHAKIKVLLEKNKIQYVSTPKKVLLNMKSYLLSADVVPNLKLNTVNSNNLLEQLDLCISRIFYHNIGTVNTFFRGLPNHNDKNLGLRFFLVTLNNEVVGTCSFYIKDNIAGFYNDGVLPIHKNHRIGTQMIIERIKIIQQLKCKYVVVHCMKPSINFYKRLGFQILVNLYLYTSST
ncbi:GNAT family N-acetyltransferase [Wolbachia endosymbiont of Dipetalonema caudispina]|uniref:GNAT family N-acetyltransferase n=1 Tax=Wolbachia endosymbiont of Dipetalonema caudispina TaxID=1812112 RepID=UPI00158DD9AA|nr:GNAT family N-acetyltransferase [Wolbachia endosymbiont of Dipetalonema caudispina]QKX01285.1 GNAT family N-acetyltransferase [Wolbachia endosymbiont of Dipetalonema caudispina]